MEDNKLYDQEEKDLEKAINTIKNLDKNTILKYLQYIPIKFKIREEICNEFKVDPDIIYTINYLDGDIYEISWNEDGQIETVNYLIGEIYTLFENGDWVIIKE